MAETHLPALTRALGDQLAESVRAPLPAYTRRRTFGRVRLPGKATAIVGMRRAGKTTFLHQLRCERIARGAARERVPYLSFEDERFAGLDAPHLGALVNEYHRRFPGSPGARCFPMPASGCSPSRGTGSRPRRPRTWRPSPPANGCSPRPRRHSRGASLLIRDDLQGHEAAAISLSSSSVG